MKIAATQLVKVFLSNLRKGHDDDDDDDTEKIEKIVSF